MKLVDIVDRLLNHTNGIALNHLKRFEKTKDAA